MLPAGSFTTLFLSPLFHAFAPPAARSCTLPAYTRNCRERPATAHAPALQPMKLFSSGRGFVVSLHADDGRAPQPRRLPLICLLLVRNGARSRKRAFEERCLFFFLSRVRVLSADDWKSLRENGCFSSSRGGGQSRATCFVGGALLCYTLSCRGGRRDVLLDAVHNASAFAEMRRGHKNSHFVD